MTASVFCKCTFARAARGGVLLALAGFCGFVRAGITATGDYSEKILGEETVYTFTNDCTVTFDAPRLIRRALIVGGGGAGGWTIGGGACGSQLRNYSRVTGKGTAGQGHDGGVCANNVPGGGGGFSEAGEGAQVRGTGYAGNGGAGLTSDISGESKTYGSGGGGGYGNNSKVAGAAGGPDAGAGGTSGGKRGGNGVDGFGGGGGGRFRYGYFLPVDNDGIRGEVQAFLAHQGGGCDERDPAGPTLGRGLYALPGGLHLARECRRG